MQSARAVQHVLRKMDLARTLQQCGAAAIRVVHLPDGLLDPIDRVLCEAHCQRGMENRFHACRPASCCTVIDVA